jgi:hypothetical protein
MFLEMTSPSEGPYVTKSEVTWFYLWNQVQMGRNTRHKNGGYDQRLDSSRDEHAVFQAMQDQTRLEFANCSVLGFTENMPFASPADAHRNISNTNQFQIGITYPRHRRRRGLFDRQGIKIPIMYEAL